MIGATFGVVRALPMLLVAHADTPPALRTRLREFNAVAPLASRVTLVTVVALPVFDAAHSASEEEHDRSGAHTASAR